MTFPNQLRTPPPNRPALQDYIKLLAKAVTVLTNASYSLDKPIGELEALEWPEREKILTINRLLKENGALLKLTKQFAGQNRLTVQDNDDPLGLLTAFDAMQKEEIPNDIFSITQTIIENCEEIQSEAARTHSAAVSGAGMELDTANDLFFNVPSELENIAPSANKMSLEYLTPLFTNDDIEKENSVKAMRELLNTNLVQPHKNNMLQMTRKGHSISIGKTLLDDNTVKYWKFDSLDNIEDKDGPYKATTLTTYDNANEMIEHISHLIRTSDNTGIEIAKINFELKPTYQASNNNANTQEKIPGDIEREIAEKARIDKEREAAQAARIEKDRTAFTRSLADNMGTFQSYQETFGLIHKKPMHQRYNAYLKQVDMLRKLKGNIKGLNISGDHPGLQSSHSGIIDSIDAELLKEEKLLNDWEGVHDIVQQIHDIKTTVPTSLGDLESQIETLSLNIEILQQMLGTYSTSNAMLKGEVDRYVGESLFTNAIQPLAQSAIDQATELSTRAFGDRNPQLAEQITQLSSKLSDFMKIIHQYAPESGKGLSSQLQKLHETLGVKLEQHYRMKF